MIWSISATEPGPPVEDEQGHGVRAFSSSVDEVDLLAFDLGDVVRPGVETSLCCPPVEVVGPVAAQVPQVVKVGALLPRRCPQLVRPPGADQTLAQISERSSGTATVKASMRSAELLSAWCSSGSICHALAQLDVIRSG